MKPFRTIATTTTPTGAKVTLHEHDGQYYLKLNGRQLMSTTCTTSELQLADLACDGLRGRADTRVLIGGLGLGFSLQRVLELVGRHAQVDVAELLPEVVEWNRELLRHVNGSLLADSRVQVLTEDVRSILTSAKAESYDAILLDVDNGPGGTSTIRTSRLYNRRGLSSILRSLKRNGKVAFWSAGREPGFTESLARSGFVAKAVPAKEHDRSKYAAHVIYVASRNPKALMPAHSPPPA